MAIRLAWRAGPLDNLFLLNGVEYTGSSQLAVTPVA